jgi:hypothetical protein
MRRRGCSRRSGQGTGSSCRSPSPSATQVGPVIPVHLPAGAGGGTPLPGPRVFRDYGSEAGSVIVARERWDALLGEAASDDVTSLGLFLEPGVGEDPAAVAAVEDALRGLGGGPRADPVQPGAPGPHPGGLRPDLRGDPGPPAPRLRGGLHRGAECAHGAGAGTGSGAGGPPGHRDDPGQTWGLVTAQTGIMGLVSGLLALPVGVALAAVMIHVVNRRSFGWSLDMEVGLALPLQAVLLALAGALLAGSTLPGRCPGPALRSSPGRLRSRPW